jgi:hypothetical protein
MALSRLSLSEQLAVDCYRPHMQVYLDQALQWCRAVVARKRWQTRTNKGAQWQGAAAASSNNIPILELHRPIFLPGKMSFCSAIFFKATFQIILEEKKMMLS